MCFNYNEYRLQEIDNTLQLYKGKTLNAQEKDLIEHLQYQRQKLLKELITDNTKH